MGARYCFDTAVEQYSIRASSPVNIEGASLIDMSDEEEVVISLSWANQSASEILAQIAEQLEDLGMSEEAVDYYQSALILQPSNDLAAYRLGKLLIKTGRFSSAIDALKIALSGSPEHVDTLYFLSVAFFNAGDYTESLNYAKQALSLVPHHTGAYLLQLRNLSALGRWKEVEELCKRAPASLDNSGEVIFWTYAAALKLGQQNLANLLSGRVPKKMMKRFESFLYDDGHYGSEDSEIKL